MTEWVMTVLDQIMGQTAPHARRHSCCRVSLSAPRARAPNATTRQLRESVVSFCTRCSTGTAPNAGPVALFPLRNIMETENRIIENLPFLDINHYFQVCKLGKYITRK